MGDTRFTIPALALLPLVLVGCDEIFTTSDADAEDLDASDAGGGGGLDGGTTNPDGNTGSDAGGSDGGGSSDDDTEDDDDGAVDSGGGADTDDGPILTDGEQELLDRLEDEARTYCTKAVECGSYDSVDECVEEYSQALVETFREDYDIDFDDVSEGCLNAIEGYVSCYVDDLYCLGDEAASDANCDLRSTQVGIACAGARN